MFTRIALLTAVFLTGLNLSAQAQLKTTVSKKYQVPVGGGFTDVTGVFTNGSSTSTLTITEALISADNPGMIFFSPLQDDLNFVGPLVLSPGDSANYDDEANFKFIARLSPDSQFPAFRTSEVSLTLKGFVDGGPVTDLANLTFTYENLNVGGSGGGGAVPEPGTVALLTGLGVCGGSLILRRRRR